jgi:hypothetical protein
MHSLLWLVFRFSSVKHEWWMGLSPCGELWWHVAVLSEPSTSKWLLMRGPVLSFSFFFFWGVAMPWSSQRVLQVLKLFTKMFPIAPHLYPIWFAQSSTLMYINVKGGPHGAHLFHFAIGSPKRVLLWAMPNALKKLATGQSIWPHFGKMKCEHTHPWTN